MDKKLLLIYNPKAGKSAIKPKLSDVIDVFTKGGYEVTVHPTQSKADVYESAKTLSPRFDVVVSAGGDGTLGEIAAGVYDSGAKPSLGIIPSGSTNDYATTLGIPRMPVEAAKYIVTGTPEPIDFGKFNDRYFIYIAAFGWFTDVSYATDQNLKNMLGHSAYLLEAGRRLFNMPQIPMKVTMNHHIYEENFVYGMVTNTRSVGGMKDFGWRSVEVDDGLHEVILVRPPKNLIELSDGLTCLMNGQPSKLLLKAKTDKLVVETKEPIKWTLDGEEGESVSKVVIENIPGAINVILND